MDYEEAFDLQCRLRERRIAKQIPDVLLLLEHPPTITVGRSGRKENILASEKSLKKKGIHLVYTNRGGDVTYHGPGQLVGYTIIDLHRYGMDLHLFLRMLEEVSIRTLERWNIKAHRLDGITGVWVENEKIASIGLHIKRGVALHGFGLNVQPNLAHFSLIYPCGIRDKGVTSIAKLIPRPLDMKEIAPYVAKVFGEIFHLDMKKAPSAGFNLDLDLGQPMGDFP